MRSLRAYLIGMATVLVVVLAAASFVIVRQVERYGREQNAREMLDTTRAMSLVVDGQLRSYLATVEALSGSTAIDAGDWAGFDRRARPLLSGDQVWIVLGDRNGNQLVNTSLPPGSKLPHAYIPAETWARLDRGEPGICNLISSPSLPPSLCVDSPVLRDGRATHHLTVIFRPELLNRLMAAGNLRQSRYASVLDRNGVVIWRNQARERFIGSKPPPETLAALQRQREGVMPSRSLEGVPTVIAFSRSALSGWTVVVGVPRKELSAPGARALRLGLATAFGALVLGGGMAALAARRVTRAIDHLNAAAQRIRRGQPPAYRPSGVAEIDAVGAALDEAVAERDADQERLRLAQEVGGIGAWEWDLVKDEGWVSEAFRQMHGLSDQQGPLRFAQLLQSIHPEDVEGYRTRVIEAARRREPTANDYRVLRPDGSVRWIYAKGRPLFDDDGRPVSALGVVMDLTERKTTEDRLRLLMREVDHRANNLMAVVQGAVSLSRASDPAELREIILGRIAALARAHQLLSESRWRGADLRRLVEEEMRPFTLGDGERVRISGDTAPLSPAAAQGAAMALHELATNAAKHGALSTPAGRIEIDWRVEDGRLRLTWREMGGPPVLPPARRGFGTTVLERALGGAVRGSTHLDWRPEGLVCEIDIPLGEAEAEP